jgi:tetratricopeptide (TPR) repeat protein
MYRRGASAAMTMTAEQFLGLLVGLLLVPAALGTAHASGEELSDMQEAFSSCSDLRMEGKEPKCILKEDAPFTIWIGAQECEDLVVTENARPISVEKRPIRGGCHLHIPAKPEVRRATLVVESRKTKKKWLTLNLERRPDPLVLTNLMLRRATADLEGVPAELRRRCNRPSSDEVRVDCLYARSTANRRQGNLFDAIDDLHEAIEIADKAGFLGIAFRLRYRLASALEDAPVPELTEAERVLLEAKSRINPGHAKDFMLWASKYGSILANRERPEEGSEWLEKAVLAAERFDDREVLMVSVPLQAELLASLDKGTQAAALFGAFQILLVGALERDKAELLSQMGWTALKLAPDEVPAGNNLELAHHSIREIFLKALAHGKKSVDSLRLANIYTGLAQTALSEGKFAEAHDWAKQAGNEPGLWQGDKLDLLNIQGRLALKQGNAQEAMRLFKELESQSATTDLRKELFACAAAMGKLESLAAQGLTDSVITAQVRSCLQKDARGLGQSESKRFHQRAKTLGFVP